MIVASLLLILVAVTLLVLGLANGSSALLISSIAASLLAAVALVVGARQAAAGRIDLDGHDPTARADDRTRPRRSAAEAPTGPWSDGASTPFAEPGGFPEPDGMVPGQPERGSRPATAHRPAEPPPTTVHPDEVPPDEPAVQPVPPADAALVARLAATVVVVDGRPRYHLPDCGHLADRDGESLPVREAVELGFTPCARCRPDSALLADVRRA
ncbi:hypothetical protein [Micromonospora zhanjiangensis]|uniref:Clumping factor A n=1 Tax=Micromonospora zhanjiangensis TaxID=1522057 RepID=A0ABV8KQ15_9ACTN